MTIPPDDWKRLLAPTQWERLNFAAYYTEERAGRILRGAVPLHDEDRWFIFSDGGWVFFARRRTGACIFGLELRGQVGGGGASSWESWVSRDKSHYVGTDVAHDRLVLAALIDLYFPA